MTYTFSSDEVMTSARIEADSISPDGHRLTTMVVTFHRFVLAEFNTHRMFSRSSASSRAIPVPKLLAKARQHPAWPLEWPSEQSGMQGGELLQGVDLLEAQRLFKDVHENTLEEIIAYFASLAAEYPDPEERKKHTLHKSVLNRLIEPFLWHTVIVTSTEWDNYFRQRASALAQPEIREVAFRMLEVYEKSTPVEVDALGLHLPFIREEERETRSQDDLIGMSVARSARVSYLNHDGTYSEEADFKLFDRLCNPGDGPPHAAPLEHVARPDANNVAHVLLDEDLGCVHRLDVPVEVKPKDGLRYFQVPLLGNFLGWTQVRHQKLGF